MSATEASRASLGEKLKFAVWGIRYFDILVLMAYPTLGAVVAIHQPGVTQMVRLAIFSIFNFLFIAQVFIFNDWSDARLNPEEPGQRRRHALKHSALSNTEVLSLVAALAVISLAGFFFISPALFAAGLGIELITVLYSQPSINLKGRPVISTLIHLVGAMLYFLGGYLAFSHPTAEALVVATFFGLVLASGHFANEIDDFRSDLTAGIRTNTIAFGQLTMFRVGIGLFIFSSVFLLAGGLWLDMNFYAACGSVLLLVWLIAAWRCRDWKGGDPVRPFRRFYRGVYAALSAAILLWRAWEWW